MDNRSDMWLKFSPLQCSLLLLKILISNIHLNRKDISLEVLNFQITFLQEQKAQCLGFLSSTNVKKKRKEKPCYRAIY